MPGKPLGQPLWEERRLKATAGDIVLSLALPLLGIAIGVMAVFKNERKRGFTMMSVGVASSVVLVILGIAASV